jgi:hypothetical protein
MSRREQAKEFKTSREMNVHDNDSVCCVFFIKFSSISQNELRRFKTDIKINLLNTSFPSYKIISFNISTNVLHELNQSVNLTEP